MNHMFMRRSPNLLRMAVLPSPTRPIGWWNNVVPAPYDPTALLTEAFLADPSPNKINLGVGAYKDEDGKPVVLQCVTEAQKKIAGKNLSESGSSSSCSRFVEESVKLAFGNDADALKESRLVGMQTLSGTGSCRLFAELQRCFLHPDSKVYLPDPTWISHHYIWRDAQVPRTTYRYYDPVLKGLNFSGLMDDIKSAPDGSCFLFHPCAHNPTGVDPTEEQWQEISYQLKVKNHFPFFDMAYQGLASGDLDKDANALRIFLRDGHSIGCAQSFTKLMGLYGQRVGCLSILCDTTKQAIGIKSQLQQIGSAIDGNPPNHGALLVSTILADPNIKELWIMELNMMRNRNEMMRAILREYLERLGSLLNWEHITNQVGMYCFSGLTPEQVNLLQTEFHIYMTHDARISMAGVTRNNVRYLANAIHEVTARCEDSETLYSRFS